MKNEHGNIKEERPENLGDLKVSEVFDTAAGMRAVIDSMKETFADAGVVHGTELLKNLNQKGGIDCNSCAWADPDDQRTLAEFCESGAKAIADEATTKRVTPEFFAKYTVQELSKQSDQWLNAQGRITHPMILREGAKKYTPISWDEAFEILAEELNSLASPDEAVFYTSGRTSNETAFMYQLFVRQFGTNNLPDCSNMCHESTSFALAESIGLGKASHSSGRFGRHGFNNYHRAKSRNLCAANDVFASNGKRKRRENYRRQSSARSRSDEFRQSESAALFQSSEISAGDARSDLDQTCRHLFADPHRRRYGVFKRRDENAFGNGKS